MTIIVASDLASYLRDPDISVDDSDVVLRLANGIVEEQLSGSQITPRVEAITLEVAARAYRNPQGFSSETTDDYTYRREAETRRAGVYLTDSEKTELRSIAAPLGTLHTVDLGTPLLRLLP